MPTAAVPRSPSSRAATSARKASVQIKDLIEGKRLSGEIDRQCRMARGPRRAGHRRGRGGPGRHRQGDPRRIRLKIVVGRRAHSMIPISSRMTMPISEPVDFPLPNPPHKGEGAGRRMSPMPRAPLAAPDVRACSHPPLSLRDISPTRGGSGGSARRRPQPAFPPCGADARQGRGGSPHIPGSIPCP